MGFSKSLRKRKTLRRKTLRRKTLRRKTLRRKTLRRKSRKGGAAASNDKVELANKAIELITKERASITKEQIQELKDDLSKQMKDADIKLFERYTAQDDEQNLVRLIKSSYTPIYEKIMVLRESFRQSW
jgi:hypothetical protein